MFRILTRAAREGVVTDPRPCDRQGPPTFPTIDFQRCTACGKCAEVCPTGAIQLSAPSAGSRSLSLSHAACTGCRECWACPEGAIRADATEGLVAYTRAQLTRRALFQVAEDGQAASFVREERLPGPTVEESCAALQARIQVRFRRSLHVRQVDAGSCNGCELEIAATSNPWFDLERFGIHFVASPRHADLLLVTGPVTRNMEIALRRTWEATPEPRVVVAVGACGCSGGIFGEGTYAALGGVDRVLPVDVYVPGCPPRPHAILAGLLVAMGIREARPRPESREARP